MVSNRKVEETNGQKLLKNKTEKFQEWGGDVSNLTPIPSPCLWLLNIFTISIDQNNIPVFIS